MIDYGPNVKSVIVINAHIIIEMQKIGEFFQICFGSWIG